MAHWPAVRRNSYFVDAHSTRSAAYHGGGRAQGATSPRNTAACPGFSRRHSDQPRAPARDLFVGTHGATEEFGALHGRRARCRARALVSGTAAAPDGPED